VLPFIVTAFVIVMLIGPVMMLRPSSLQKKQSALRRIAAEQGLIVSSGEISKNGQHMVNYILPDKENRKDREVWVLKKEIYAHEAHFCDEWNWAKTPGKQAFTNENEVKNLLKSGAHDFVTITSDRLGISVTWLEKLRGDTEEMAVSKVKHFLTEMERHLA
jgi:hypothetical protein